MTDEQIAEFPCAAQEEKCNFPAAGNIVVFAPIQSARRSWEDDDGSVWLHFVISTSDFALAVGWG